MSSVNTRKSSAADRLEVFTRGRDGSTKSTGGRVKVAKAGSVLIEGIGTERDRIWALQAGADLGQGYYWPSWTWPED